VPLLETSSSTQEVRSSPTVSTQVLSALPWKWMAGVGGIAILMAGLLIAQMSGDRPRPTPTAIPVVVALEPTASLTNVAPSTRTPVPPTNTPPRSTPTDTPLLPTDTPLPASTRTSTSTPLPLPCVPSLISPEQGAIVDNGRIDRLDTTVWDFDWSDCQGATRYHLYVVGPHNVYPLIDDQAISDSSYHRDEPRSYVADKNRLGWTWKVRARLGEQWGEWSETRTFDFEPVDSDPPSQ
jgi:hypothetical protein